MQRLAVRRPPELPFVSDLQGCDGSVRVTGEELGGPPGHHIVIGQLAALGRDVMGELAPAAQRVCPLLAVRVPSGSGEPVPFHSRSSCGSVLPCWPARM